MSALRRITAVALSLVLPGAGHASLGRVRRGLVWLALTEAMLVVIAYGGAEGRMTIVAAGVAGYLLLVLLSAADLARLGAAGLVPPKLVPTVLLLLGFYVGWTLGPILNRAYLADFYRIGTRDMLPALYAGDRVFVDRRGRPPERGDVIAFEWPNHPGLEGLSRVIAVGGDSIAVRGGVPVVNGTPLAQRPVGEEHRYKGIDPNGNSTDSGTWRAMYELVGGREIVVLRTAHEAEPSIDEMATQTVPAGAYWVMADNRDNASDSRRYGPIPAANVRGIARIVFWSNDPAHICLPAR